MKVDATGLLLFLVGLISWIVAWGVGGSYNPFEADADTEAKFQALTLLWWWGPPLGIVGLVRLLLRNR